MDLLGLIPLVGNIADIANAGISTLRGRPLEAALSLMAAIPLAGIAVGAGKTIGRLFVRLFNPVADLLRKVPVTTSNARVVRSLDNVLGKAGSEEMVQAVDEVAEVLRGAVDGLPHDRAIRVIKEAGGDLSDEQAETILKLLDETEGAPRVRSDAASEGVEEATDTGVQAVEQTGRNLDEVDEGTGAMEPIAPRENPWDDFHLPADDKGTWSGVRGNSNWTPHNPSDYGLKPGESVRFVEGYIDLNPHVWKNQRFNVPGLTGIHETDMPLIWKKIARDKGWIHHKGRHAGKEQIKRVKNWLSKNNVTPCRFPQSPIPTTSSLPVPEKGPRFRQNRSFDSTIRRVIIL